MAPSIQRNSTAALLPPVPVRIELGVEKMPVPNKAGVSEQALHEGAMHHTNHFIDDQGRHRHIAESLVLRHGSQPVGHFFSR